MKFFDSHAHYDDKQFGKDAHGILVELSKDGYTIVNIGADMRSSRASVKLSEKYPHVFATVGVHPHYVKNLTDADMDELRTLAKSPKIVALGEMGLDYYRDLSPRDVQKNAFLRQLDLAKEMNLPIVVHSREAEYDTFKMITDSGIRRGVVHCFSGSLEMAREYVKLGYYLGIGGVVTYSNSKKLHQVVSEIPLEHLVLETDSPYLPPDPKRGSRNDSRNIPLIAEKIAEIKSVPVEAVAEITFDNAQSLYGLGGVNQAQA